jgi:hypothetical protein
MFARHKTRLGVTFGAAAALLVALAPSASAKEVKIDVPLTYATGNVAEVRTAPKDSKYSLIYSLPDYMTVTTYKPGTSTPRITRQVVSFFLQGREKNIVAVKPSEVYGPWTNTGARYTYVGDKAKGRYPAKGGLNLKQSCKKENEGPHITNQYRAGVQVRTYTLNSDGSVGPLLTSNTAYSGVLVGTKLDCVPDGK